MLCIKVFLTVFSISAAYSNIEEKYHTALLRDQVKLKKFYTCLVNKSPCDRFGQEVKKRVLEVLSDSRKDVKQKHYAHITMTLMKTDYPELYEAFEAKYDPQRKLLQNLLNKTKDI